jgi:uncharacterized membrane protein
MRLHTAAIIILGIAALIGFADALYLTINAFANTVPPCLIGGCEVVTTSVYSRIFGIPIALFGALYYVTIMTLLVMHVDFKDEIKKGKILVTIFLIVNAGALVSLFLVALQLFVLNAICQYCMISALASFIICATLWHERWRTCNCRAEWSS